ncbi:MAG: GNAT family N-acetyltransferase [Nocardioides sp.]|uniref:GNAT family N-acetyltransferase n=1 Tax=Nocardioides sp. TaxID=35761 RepID=UPI003F118C4B
MESQGVVLRAMRPEEVGLPWHVGDLEPGSFDDFGPRPALTAPRSPSFDGDGALVVEVDGRVAGSVSWIWRVHGPNAGSRCLMVGIALFADARGGGTGSRALAELVSLGFRHTTTNRIEAHTDVLNVPAQRALERAGFTREGVLRGAQWRDGDYRDGALFSVLREEWEFRGSQQ